jgi:predicted nucleic acid-binding protein
MSQIVVDTDVATYIFNWHSLAQQYADSLRGSELILSFMTIAELRMGALSAGWGSRRRLLLEQFMQRFDTRTTTYVRFGRGFASMHERQAGH